MVATFIATRTITVTHLCGHARSYTLAALASSDASVTRPCGGCGYTGR